MLIDFDYNNVDIFKTILQLNIASCNNIISSVSDNYDSLFNDKLDNKISNYYKYTSSKDSELDSEFNTYNKLSIDFNSIYKLSSSIFEQLYDSYTSALYQIPHYRCLFYLSAIGHVILNFNSLVDFNTSLSTDPDDDNLITLAVDLNKFSINTDDSTVNNIIDDNKDKLYFSSSNEDYPILNPSTITYGPFRNSTVEVGNHEYKRDDFRRYALNIITNICKYLYVSSICIQNLSTINLHQFFTFIDNYNILNYINIFKFPQNSIVSLYQIYCLLLLFNNILNKIKQFTFNIKFLYNYIECVQSTCSESRETNTDGDDLVSDKYHYTHMLLSPYSHIIKYTKLIPKNSGNYSYNVTLINNNTIKCSTLIYSNNVKHFNTILTNPHNFNGNFIISCTSENFIKQTYKLTFNEFNKYFKSNNIIQLSQILELIDTIFNKWITNIELISYNILICHGNCHNNIINTKFSSSCCYCGKCTNTQTT